MLPTLVVLISLAPASCVFIAQHESLRATSKGTVEHHHHHHHHHYQHDDRQAELLIYRPKARWRGFLPIKMEWTDLPNYTYGKDKKRNLWDDFFLQPYEVMGYKNVTGKEYAEVEEEHKYMKEDLSEGFGTKKGIEISEEKMELGRNLVQQYIRVKPNIQAEVAEFYAKHLSGFKSPAAVHIRLTDKITQSEENFESKADFRKKIEEFMASNGHDAFFLATDSAKVKSYLKKYFGEKCVVYPSTLSTNNSHHGAVHKDLSIRGFKKAKDIVMETLIMASCDAFISTFSSVSNGVRWLGQSKLAKDHHYFLHEHDA